ncbi:diguanylate cyclase domain-containing protein [Isoalcanivorax indicus]|uniref:diguanylate cyclase domain-containing protein n=1 Tax=Isoalcanivorax indicus TaxID=2202653 RepID=UPI000DBA240F|nr:diguanylate cyclase [Isoalcanivorax indicus]
MSDTGQAVLLVEADIDRARRIETSVVVAGEGDFRVEHVATLACALERLACAAFEVVLASMTLPGVDRAEVFSQLRLAAPDALVLPLDENDSERPESPVSMSWLPGALHYVAHRKRAEMAWRKADEALFEEKERARVTLGSIGDAVLVTDVQGNVTYLNQVAESLTGWSCARARGQKLPVVFNITDSGTGKRARNPALHAMAENQTVGLAANCVLHRLDGSEVGIEDSAAPVYDRYGHVTGAVIVFRDVNQSRTVTRKMAWLGSHDSLTGLANRILLEERFKQVISLAHRHARQAAMLFVDMDNFKQINDVFGHRVGDLVLQAVAGNLLHAVRDTDTVCRLGGDEFVILLADVASLAAAEQVAAKLLALVAEPVQVDGHQVSVAMSIGISMYPGDGEDMHALIEHADAAMYQEKRRRSGALS